jgi:hypothetical protein
MKEPIDAAKAEMAVALAEVKAELPIGRRQAFGPTELYEIVRTNPQESGYASDPCPRNAAYVRHADVRAGLVGEDRAIHRRP